MYDLCPKILAKPCNQQEATSFAQVSSSTLMKCMLCTRNLCHGSSCATMRQPNKTKTKMSFQKFTLKPAPKCNFSI